MSYGGYGAPPPGGQPYGQPVPGQVGYPGMPPQAQPFGGPPPGVDPQVFSWFVAVDSDRSGRISQLELQQALTNANWSHFNAETCRLMIGMFDRDLNGTIDINEFQALWNYIHQWKGVFDRFDRDRSGSIDCNELHQAYNEMGFRLTPQFANLAVTRFDHTGQRRMTLDNFIQSCVLLKSITDTFRQRDTAQQGIINISYDDFMTMSILNKP